MSILHERLGPLRLATTVDSFTQLNPAVAARAYGVAAAWAPEGVQVVWDLYCGVGGLGLRVAHERGAKVFGIESHQGAVRLAGENAAAAKIEAHFEVGDLELGAPEGWPEPGLILVNPPRRGLSSTIRALLARQRAPFIYMSCNPKTLTRDLLELQEIFQVEEIRALEMLPLSGHLEVLVSMSPREVGVESGESRVVS